MGMVKAAFQIDGANILRREGRNLRRRRQMSADFSTGAKNVSY